MVLMILLMHYCPEMSHISLQVKIEQKTYYLSLGTSKIKEHHPDAVVWGHSEALKRLLEENILPDTHFFGEQCETVIDVNSQQALFPIPTADCQSRKNSAYVA